MTDAIFVERPWRTEFDGILGLPKGMLGHYEASLLFHLARDYWRGYGHIVDLGAFIGCSSFCFARGMEANPRLKRRSQRLHAYDLFQVWSEPNGTDAERAAWLKRDYDIETSQYESTAGVYMANLGALARNVRIHQGDILKEAWSGRPIELLFVDIAKTQAVWAHVLRTFFPSLIPGVSLVIHQDWHHPFLPFLHVGQEALAEFFELVVPRANDTAVFRLADHIPESVLDDVASFEFTPDEQLALMDRAMARFPGENRAMKLARAELLRQHRRFDMASEAAHLAYTAHGETMDAEEAAHFWAYARGVMQRIEADDLDNPSRARLDEAAYLAANPDVAEAVRTGFAGSGRRHWYSHGRWEGRSLAP